MKKKLLELTTIEFCRILLDFPEVYTLNLGTIDENGEEDCVVGTYDQLRSCFKSVNFQQGLEYVENNLFDYSNIIGDTEQLEFIYTKTHGFNERFCKVMYDEMDCFYQMMYVEEINEEVYKKYIDEDWEIPIKKIPRIISKDEWIKDGYNIPDYAKMREKVFPCRQWSYNKVMNELKEHIKIEKKDMEQVMMKKVLRNLYSPDAVKIYFFGYSDFYSLMSAENTNDLLHWFSTNHKQLEKNLKEIGYTWCYEFEYNTKVQAHPCIYLYFGKDVSDITVKEFNQDSINSAPPELKFALYEGSFSEIDLLPYLTQTEKLVLENGGEIFNVQKFSSNNIDDYKFTQKRIRHLADENVQAETNITVPSPSSIIDFLSKDPKGSELAILLAVCVTLGIRDTEERPAFINWLAEKYPNTFKGKETKYTKRLNDALPNKRIGNIKTQGELIDFVKSCHKRNTEKVKYSQLATKMFLALKK